MFVILACSLNIDDGLLVEVVNAAGGAIRVSHRISLGYMYAVLNSNTSPGKAPRSAPPATTPSLTSTR